MNRIYKDKVCKSCNNIIKNVVNPTQCYHKECYTIRKKENDKLYRKIHKIELRQYQLAWHEKRLGRPSRRLRRNVLTEKMKEVNFELGYVLGTLYGDGGIYVGKSAGHALLRVTDKDFADFYLYNLKKIYPYSIQTRIDEPKGIGKKQMYVVLFNSHDYCKYLDDFNINDLDNLSTNFKIGFIKGMYDSEGCVVGVNLDNPKIINRTINFTQKNEDMIKLMSNILSELNIKHSINSKVNSGFNTGNTYFNINIYSYEYITRFRDLIGFSIKRKMDKIEIILKTFQISKKCIECKNDFKPSSSNQILCENSECYYSHMREYWKNRRQMKKDECAILS